MCYGNDQLDGINAGRVSSDVYMNGTLNNPNISAFSPRSEFGIELKTAYFTSLAQIFIVFMNFQPHFGHPLPRGAENT